MHDHRARRHVGPAADGSADLLAALDAVSAFGAAPVYRRRQIERTVEALLTILDAMDGDTDREPEEDRGELDHLTDDDAVHVLDLSPLRRSNLFASGQGVRHG